MNTKNQKYATGRRKRSVARVFATSASKGKGSIQINKRPFDQYFKNSKDRNVVNEVLEITGKEGSYDFYITVVGGGVTGQKEAIVHAISQIIAEEDSEKRSLLKKGKYLTRDARQVESKKYGYKKARKKPQFSKR